MRPNTFSLRQKQFFENGAGAFRTAPTGENTASKQRIAALEAKLAVLPELMGDHLRPKKELGAP